MPSHDDSTSFFARRKTWVAVWLVFLSIVFLFGWRKSVENARDTQARRVWYAEQAELTKAGQIEWTRFIAQLDSLQGKPGSQKALEDELNGGAPFDLQPLEPAESRNNKTRKVFKWSHPKYGATYSFEFDNGVLVGRGAHWGGVPETLHPQPILTARTNSAERLRQHVARFASYTWLAAIACWIVLRNWRLASAHVSLAAALACGMAWLVNPVFSITFNGVFSNDNLFFAALMLAASAALLGISSQQRSAKTPLVSEFRFRLFDLLVIITAAAILLAAGPFGYVTLLAAVAVALVFALFFYFFRLRGALTI
jgi:hypothetical protein